MCTYNITVSDSLIERARPAIGYNTDMASWLQRQVEELLLRMSTAPQRTKEHRYHPDLETILAMPILDDSDVGMNGEKARMRHLKEKYDL